MALPASSHPNALSEAHNNPHRHPCREKPPRGDTQPHKASFILMRQGLYRIGLGGGQIYCRSSSGMSTLAGLGVVNVGPLLHHFEKEKTPERPIDPPQP